MDLEENSHLNQTFEEPFQIFLPPSLNEMKKKKIMLENTDNIEIEDNEKVKTFLIEGLDKKLDGLLNEIWTKKLKKFILKLINITSRTQINDFFEIHKRIKIVFINIGKDLNKQYNQFLELLTTELIENEIHTLKPLDHDIFNSLNEFDQLCVEITKLKKNEKNNNVAFLFDGLINYNEDNFNDFLKLFSDEILSKEINNSFSFIWYLPIEGVVNFKSPFHFVWSLNVDFYDSRTIFRKILFSYLSNDFLPLFDKDSLRNILNKMEIFDLNLNEAMRRMKIHFMFFVKNINEYDKLAILEQNIIKKDKIAKKLKNLYVDVWDSQAKIAIGLQIIKDLHKKIFNKKAIEKGIFKFFFECGKYKGLNEKIYSIKTIEEIEKIGKDIANFFNNKPKQIKCIIMINFSFI